MLRKFVLAVFLLSSCSIPAYRPGVAPPPELPSPVPPQELPKPPKIGPHLDGATEALDEVNATRAKRGLHPFARDNGLTQGAMNVAAYRAQRLIAGHSSNDFSFLPPGVHAEAAGCAAWEPEWGWGACCTYESWRTAGAAWVQGRDGRRYMHLFVRY